MTKAVSQLDEVSQSLARELIQSSPKTSRLLSFQITLLEVFSREIKRLDKLKTCDYELAYVSYHVSSILCSHCSSIDDNELTQSIRDTLVKKSGGLNTIEQHLQTPSEDPLLARLASLKTSNKPQQLDKYRQQESISASELKSIFASHKVLLIDFRTSKEFNYSHINHPEIVNVEPSHVSALSPSAHDTDLDSRLEMHLSRLQYERFHNRNQYDLVVVYNLRYGGTSGDRLTDLKKSLLNDDVNGMPGKNPFQNLIDLLTTRVKYVSNELKRPPVFLAGGLANWHGSYGDGSLAKATAAAALIRPQASVMKGGSESPSRSSSYASGRSSSFSEKSPVLDTKNSPYLRNFGEYLSKAKTSASTPISTNFTPSNDTLAPINVHDYGKPKIETPPQQQPVKRTLSNGSSLKPIDVTVSLKQKATDPTKFLEQYATGLTNLGNSCYMNCVLQCLGATPQLTRFFFPSVSKTASNGVSLQSYRQHINVNNKLGTKGILTTNFVSLLADMFNNTGKYFTPMKFKKVVGSLSPGHQFASFDQQDCIEFLNFILDGLHEDLNQMMVESPEEKKAITELTPEQEKTREILPIRLASTIEWERYLKLNFSIIVDFFQGQYLSHLKCLECGLTSTTYNAFSILSLPIPEKLGSFAKVLLSDCLKEFTTTELLDDDNKWHCPRCKKFTRLTKKITITRLPEVLIIHFKRFRMTPTGYFNKMDTFVTYPVNDTLDLTPYWPPVGTSIEPNKSLSVPLEKEQQILSTLPTRNQQAPFRYKLYGVANHFGNLTTGHYTSYVHKSSDSRKTREWCYFDDAKVSYNCKESQVLNKNAYCLFYQRV